MGMPITVEIADSVSNETDRETVFDYFKAVDARFSTYKKDSEISSINRRELSDAEWSAEMQEVFALAEKTKKETNGFFDIRKPDGTLDPSGIVKGWAIKNAADILRTRGHTNFFIDAGGDIESSGVNTEGMPWSVGIKNPFTQSEIVKVVYPKGEGVATSGSYIRGDHIYNPLHPNEKLDTVVSLTVIGPNVLEADRFATAAFAMGTEGISFIEQLPGFEGYEIDKSGRARLTSGFVRYTTR